MFTLALGLDFSPVFQILVAAIFFAVWYVVIRRAVRDGIGDAMARNKSISNNLKP